MALHKQFHCLGDSPEHLQNFSPIWAMGQRPDNEEESIERVTVPKVCALSSSVLIFSESNAITDHALGFPSSWDATAGGLSIAVRKLFTTLTRILCRPGAFEWLQATRIVTLGCSLKKAMLGPFEASSAKISVSLS